HTQHNLLTPIQLLEVADAARETSNGLRLESLNDNRKIKCMLAKLEDHTTLTMALSQADMPWLRHLLQTALKNGVSVCSIIQMIEDALECGYQPCNHSSEAHDLMLLIY
ncbi:hypothetical protein BS17DRAFT_691839, partial [Gyrodon lividus]